MFALFVSESTTLRELIFAGINFCEFHEFLKTSRNLFLAKIMKMCKLAKFAKFNSREKFSQVKIAFFLHFQIFLLPKITQIQTA